MKKATIKLKPNSGLSIWQMIRYLFRKRKQYEVSLPANWTEMPEAAFVYLMKKRTGSISHAEELRFLLLVTELPEDIFLRIDPVDFTEKLLPHVRWAFTEAITYPVVRVVRVGEQSFAMPNKEFRSMQLRDFAACEKAFARAIQPENPDDITTFLASVLRPIEPDQKAIETSGDWRVPYSEYLVEQNKAVFSKLTSEYVIYVLTFWQDCRYHLKELYPEAFSSGSGDGNDDLDWADIMSDIAETGIFGSLQDVQRLDVHSFYRWMAKKGKEKEKAAKEAFMETMKQQHKRAFA